MKFFACGGSPLASWVHHCAKMAWHGMQLEERGESFYNPFLGPLVAELAGQGIIEDSNGAKVWIASTPHSHSLSMLLSPSCFLCRVFADVCQAPVTQIHPPMTPFALAFARSM